MAVNTRTGTYLCHRCEAKGLLVEYRDHQFQRAGMAKGNIVASKKTNPDPPDNSWRKEVAPDKQKPLRGSRGGQYLTERGIDCDLAHEAGGRFIADFSGRPAVVFPIRDPNGRLVAVHGRYTDGRDDPDMRTQGEILHGAFWSPRARDAQILVVTESPIKALALAQAGMPALGLCGIANRDWFPAFAQGRIVLISFDADETGDEQSPKWAKRLQSEGIDWWRMRPVGAKDWDVFLAQGKLEQLRIEIATVLLALGTGGGDDPFTPETPEEVLAAVKGLELISLSRFELDHQVDVPHPGNSWPAPLGEAAYHGLAGELVRTIEPHTEADPAAVLIQFLVGFGCVIGRSPAFRVEGDLHRTNLFATLVGETSKARKGTSWSQVLWILRSIDEEFACDRVWSGLSSGEGLMYQVRDEQETQEPIRGKDRRIEGYQTVITDKGEDDKRLLVTETELASALKVAEREGNRLSPMIREAWDSGTLRTMTKSPMKATGAHISIIGHITRDELLRTLTATETANGFANRFLWLCVKRSQLLPDGGNISEVDFARLLRLLRNAVEFASKCGTIVRSPEARELWHSVYPRLSAGSPGLLGAVTGRAEAQVTRLSMIYALLDRSSTIERVHLEAGLEVWRYAEESARYIFGERLGDHVADTILEALRKSDLGLTRTEINNLFGRNVPAARIAVALSSLQEAGLVRTEVRRPELGRPAEVYFAI